MQCHSLVATGACQSLLEFAGCICSLRGFRLTPPDAVDTLGLHTKRLITLMIPHKH
jgi:hypothetical protein